MSGGVGGGGHSCVAMCIAVYCYPLLNPPPQGGREHAAFAARLDSTSSGIRSKPFRSHIRIVRPAAALRRHPGDVLVRVLDVAGLAVDAVLRVDHEARRRPPPPPIRRRRPGNSAPTARHRRRARTPSAGPRSATLQMHRLVLLVVGVGQEHRGQPVEGEHAVGLRIGDRRASARRLQRRGVRLAVAERAEQREAGACCATCRSRRARCRASVPNCDHSGLTLRTRFRSVPMSRVAPAPPRSRRARHARGPRRAPPRRAPPPACRRAWRCGCP